FLVSSSDTSTTFHLGTSTLKCGNNFIQNYLLNSFHLDADSAFIYTGMNGNGSTFQHSYGFNFNYVETDSMVSGDCHYNHLLTSIFVTTDDTVNVLELKTPYVGTNWNFAVPYSSMFDHVGKL